jgi:hypothetical protein
MTGNTTQLRLSQASVVGWQKCITVSVLGYSLELCIGFSVLNDQITMELAVVVNGQRYVFHETISGNQCFSIPILGFELETCISKWVVNQDTVTFTLSIYVVAFIKVKIFEEQITLPLPEAEEIAALESIRASDVQELTHVLGLFASTRAIEVGASTHGSADTGCSCGERSGEAVPGNCPPPSVVGSCYEPSGQPIPGKFNCAACCGLRAAGFWVGPEGKVVFCE